MESDFPISPGRQIELRVFVDRSVIEVFANGTRARLTGRAYPIKPASLNVAVWAQGGAVECSQLEAWEMKGIY